MELRVPNREELALWALTVSLCWLGPTIEGGQRQWVAVHRPRPYASPEVITGTYDPDPWKCLEKAYTHFWDLYERDTHSAGTDNE